MILHLVSGLVLTEQDGLTGTIPEFEADDGEVIPEYTGLIAYSESLEHSVLQLDN
ncbi:hypothetical protein NQM03_002860 [Escherichia coli]|nr:hypothetical protein [Escherichia coli]